MPTHNARARHRHAHAAFGGAVGPSSDLASESASASAVYTIAAELAADGARGPGTFAVRLLDTLNELDEATIAARLVIT